MFALWLTGLPGSGKSTIGAVLIKRMHDRGIDPVLLESGEVRRWFLTRSPASEEDRESFFKGLAHLASVFVEHGIPVIVEATARRRAYRDSARDRITKFVEVFVDCPPEVCLGRKVQGEARPQGGDLPQYEPSERPEVHLRSDLVDPETAARRIVDVLVLLGLLPSGRARRALKSGHLGA